MIINKIIYNTTLWYYVLPPLGNTCHWNWCIYMYFSSRYIHFHSFWWQIIPDGGSNSKPAKGGDMPCAQGYGSSCSYTNLLHSCILWQEYDILLPDYKQPNERVQGWRKWSAIIGSNFGSLLPSTILRTGEYSIQKLLASWRYVTLCMACLLGGSCVRCPLVMMTSFKKSGGLQLLQLEQAKESCHIIFLRLASPIKWQDSRHKKR